MLVVDEAHHLAWSETAPSREYQVIERLTHHIPSVLLLTATPEQLGMQSHFARLRLLDPNCFHDYQAFADEQQRYRPVADTVALLLNDEPLPAQYQTALKVAGIMGGKQGLDERTRHIALPGADLSTV
ncbi:MAG: hypothetical protein ACR5LG_09505 [Sodalis sp. (in: enterobacteria)]|uniref:hypothetical protein n=1 Tax=Sodalis sp. (in: enterobacteria) TaxID=1898979 RepID=UPI003F2F5226